MSSIKYEIETVEKMIRLYCRHKHGNKSELCQECNLLYQYASSRLYQCPFGDKKTACRDCKVHCYKPQIREKIRDIMRFSGPRMLLYHPSDFIIHLTKDRK